MRWKRGEGGERAFLEKEDDEVCDRLPEKEEEEEEEEEDAE